MADPILLTGPPMAGKTQEARRLLREAAGPMIAADFQQLLVAVMLLERDPGTGRYPERLASQAAWLLPLVESLRQTLITFARDREIGIVASNSDGSPARRAYLLSRLGVGASERILDPGFDVVTQRLSNPDGTISEQCVEARDRFYSRRTL